MYESYARRGSGLFGAFLLGGLIGAALGLLFAPRSGKETRDLIAEKGREYWEDAGELYDQGVAKATELYEAGREKAAETADDVRGRVDVARERLRETVAEASRGAKPAVSKAASAAKSGLDVAEAKAQDALDFVIEKTEAPAPDAAAVPVAADAVAAPADDLPDL
ncbi:MAG: YtxH domain-containing protein [Actinobacteria bacterium]|nr:MAG: YtxH domain-containing protein [Actinomycetota bacterium]